MGYPLVDAVSILGTHLAELIRRHAHGLLSRQDTKNILDRVADENPKVIEDLVPKLLPSATVQRALQNLLRAGQVIPDDLKPATKDRLAARVLGGAPRASGAAA